MLEYLNSWFAGSIVGAVGSDRRELRGVRERACELPEVAVVAVAHDAAAVGQQLAQRAIADRLAGEVRQPGVDAVVEPQAPCLDQPEHRVAVKVFECEATRNRCAGVIAVPPSSRRPRAPSSTPAGRRASTAACTPGMRS